MIGVSNMTKTRDIVYNYLSKLFEQASSREKEAIVILKIMLNRIK